MANKQLIKKLRDNAELAWAAYGYYDLMTNENNDFYIKVENDESKQDKDDNSSRKPIFIQDILDITYKDYKVYKPSPLPTLKPEKIGKLEGDMSPYQIQNFFKRYELIEHCPNTDSGFSATLFQDKESKEFTLAFRGTEFNLINRSNDVINDVLYTDLVLALDKIPQQYFDMITFIETKVKPKIYDKENKIYFKITATGHSLGGYLTQLFSLSYYDLVDKAYTYNAPGVLNDGALKELLDTKLSNIKLLNTKTREEILNDSLMVITLFQKITQNLTDAYNNFKGKELKPYNMMNIKDDDSAFYGMMEMNEELFKQIQGPDSNTRQLIIINTNSQLQNTIPYFLRTDQEEITLQNSKNGQIKIFYQKNMQKYAKELYNEIERQMEIYQGKTFYIYYAYVFNRSAEYQITKSQLITLSYDFNIPYGNFKNQCQALRENNAYIKDTLKKEQIFHIISKGIKTSDDNEFDMIGSLGKNILGKKCEIQIGLNGFIDKHSILPLTQTLYFYSYLLELPLNEDKIKDKDLEQALFYLNQFMENIKTYIRTFVFKDNEINKNVLKKNNDTQRLDFFERFFSLIAFMMQENEKFSNQNFSTLYKNSIIKREEIIAFILQMQEKEKYILMLDKEDLNSLRKDCAFINEQDNIAYKLALGDLRLFIVFGKNNPLENCQNMSKIYGYNSKSYKMVNEPWDEQFLGGLCKMSQSLYFDGKAEIYVLNA